MSYIDHCSWCDFVIFSYLFTMPFQGCQQHIAVGRRMGQAVEKSIDGDGGGCGCGGVVLVVVMVLLR